jgi:hypothetical protein
MGGPFYNRVRIRWAKRAAFCLARLRPFCAVVTIFFRLYCPGVEVIKIIARLIHYSIPPGKKAPRAVIYLTTAKCSQSGFFWPLLYKRIILSFACEFITCLRVHNL